jgi:hypothetical protein
MLHLDESRSHDRERMLWIACYSVLSAVVRATIEDLDPTMTRVVDFGGWGRVNFVPS